MNNPVPNSVSVTINPTFGEVFVASLTLVRYQRMLILVHAVFPLAGLFILLASLRTGRHLGIEGVLVILLAFSFTPLVIVATLWAARRGNKLGRGPLTYSFDSEGVHTSGTAFDQTIKWPAIPRARQSKRFLFIFISPSHAFAIPIKALSEQGVLDEVRSVTRQHTDFR